MEGESRIILHLAGPVLKCLRYRQGKFPQATLEPLASYQDATEPRRQVDASALGRIFAPIGPRDPQARREKREKQRNEDIFEGAELLMIAAHTDDEQPGVIEWVRAHV